MEILYAVLLGLVAVAIFFAPTILSFRLIGRDTNVVLAVFLGGWIVKVVVLVVSLIALRPLTFFNHNVFAAVILIGAVACTALEVRTILKRPPTF